VPASDDKIVDRVEKLLRLAAPDSNTTESERASAALEAARLVAEHGLVVSRRGANVEVAPHAWVLTQALNYHGCSHCGSVISPRDIIWMRTLPGHRQEYRHNSPKCRIADTG
jgi:hypothetical protein